MTSTAWILSHLVVGMTLSTPLSALVDQLAGDDVGWSREGER